MHKLMVAFFMVIVLLVLQTSAFATSLNCKFKSKLASVNGVDSIQLDDDNLLINGNLEIPLDKTRVNCGNFKRQTRLDGAALGYQVVLKSCTDEAALEGFLIDSVKAEIADVVCN